MQLAPRYDANGRIGVRYRPRAVPLEDPRPFSALLANPQVRPPGL